MSSPSARGSPPSSFNSPAGQRPLPTDDSLHPPLIPEDKKMSIDGGMEKGAAKTSEWYMRYQRESPYPHGPTPEATYRQPSSPPPVNPEKKLSESTGTE